MKNLSYSFSNHLEQEVTTLCWCWQITRTDGVILGFTNLDRNLTINGITYAAATGFTPSAIASDSSLSVNNLEVNSILDDASIRTLDLIGGKFDHARVKVFLVNYLDLPDTLDSSNYLLLVNGVLGEIKCSDYSFSAEVRSLAQFLTQKSTNLTSKLCRYNLGDNKCTVDLTPFTHILAVDTVIDRRTFIADPSFDKFDGYLNYGSVEFSSGANTGVRATVARQTSQTIELFEPLPEDLESGDSLIAIAGCRKTTQDCQGRYQNILNYGGEPHVPGGDKYMRGAN